MIETRTRRSAGDAGNSAGGAPFGQTTERAAATAAEQIAARLGELPEWRGVTAAPGFGVAGFVAVRGEIDPVAVLARARAAGARVALPRVPSDEEVRARPERPRLRFHLAPAGELSRGRFGIPEPDASCSELDAEQIALLLVPGLAFDARGNRLGFGGGYYDEWLTSAGARRPPFVVGLAYDFQIVDECPAGDTDARVDCVVTEARVLRCQGGGSGGGRESAGSRQAESAEWERKVIS